MTEAITHIATVGGFIAVAVLAVDVVARIVAWWQKRRRYKSMVALVRDGEELGLYDDQHTRCPSPDSSVTDIKGGFSYPPGDRISGSTSLDSSGVVLAPVHPARAAHDALSAPGRFSFPIAPACRLTSTPPQLPTEPFPLNTDVAPAPDERHDDGTAQEHSHDEWRHLPEGQ